MQARIVALSLLSVVSLFAEGTPGAISPVEAPADSGKTFRSDVSLVRVDAQVVDQRRTTPLTAWHRKISFYAKAASSRK